MPERVKNAERTCALVSLGCPKNLVDSERMLGLLHLEGYRWVEEPRGADVVIVNTCGFLDVAREESLATIREMLALKEQGLVGGVIVAGCMVEREREALLEQCPGVDQMVGVFGRDQIVIAAERVRGGVSSERTILPAASDVAPVDAGRLRITVPHLAYLRIAEGCDRTCSFCSIPSIRGKYVSKPIEQVVDEAEELAGDGARELVVVAQDTSFYGMDLGGRPQLAALVERLEAVAGIEWIRLMYLYPMHVTEELIERIAGSRKILPYLDLPLQHANDEVLRRMKRRVTRSQTEELLDRLRERIPGLVLRTTLIAGFPGETETQFKELVQFVRKRRFERLGVFAYRLEPGTASAELDGQLPEAVREKRRDRLLAAQQPIAFAWNRSQVGRKRDVLIDAGIPGQPDAYVGRSYMDAPEVDGVVYVTGGGLRPGQIVACEIVESRGYDLIGVAEGEPR